MSEHYLGQVFSGGNVPPWAGNTIIGASSNGAVMTATEFAERVFLHPLGRDPVIRSWAYETLVWLADKGVGYLDAPTIEYDDDYWAKYEEYAETALGRRLTVERIELVQRHARPNWPGAVIDIGIGCGDFVTRAAASWGVDVVGYDVSRRACEWLTDRGLYRNPYEDRFEIATFWDSLEHIPDVYRILKNVTRFVFAALPIVPGNGPPPPGWKHLRPGEHFFYFTRDGFIAWMQEQGFVCIEANTNESVAGREDIGSFAFARVE